MSTEKGLQSWKETCTVEEFHSNDVSISHD